MYENVYPNLALALLFVRTEVECGKGPFISNMFPSVRKANEQKCKQWRQHRSSNKRSVWLSGVTNTDYFRILSDLNPMRRFPSLWIDEGIVVVFSSSSQSNLLMQYRIIAELRRPEGPPSGAPYSKKPVNGFFLGKNGWRCCLWARRHDDDDIDV